MSGSQKKYLFLETVHLNKKKKVFVFLYKLKKNVNRKKIFVIFNL